MLGLVFAFIPLLWPRAFRLSRYMGLSIICLIGGMAVASLQAAAFIVGGFALVAGILLVMGLTDWWYRKRFPVFDTEPKWSFADERGYWRDMYIAAVGSHFIIGMVYDVEADGTEARLWTHWKDKFDTYEAAEKELWLRAVSYGLTAETPIQFNRQRMVHPLIR